MPLCGSIGINSAWSQIQIPSPRKIQELKINTNTGLCAPVCGSGGVNPIWSPAPQRLVTLLRVALPRFLQHWDLYLNKRTKRYLTILFLSVFPCIFIYAYIWLFLRYVEICGWNILWSKDPKLEPLRLSRDLTGGEYQFKIHLTNEIYKNATLSS